MRKCPTTATTSTARGVGQPGQGFTAGPTETQQHLSSPRLVLAAVVLLWTGSWAQEGNRFEAFNVSSELAELQRRPGCTFIPTQAEKSIGKLQQLTKAIEVQFTMLVALENLGDIFFLS